MEIIKYIVLALFGLGSGIVVSAGVFSLIATVGIIPRMAEKTKTKNRIMIYEEAIIFGGIAGALTLYINFRIPVGMVASGIFSLCTGVFFGELAVSIAEVLNVCPIFMKRFKLKKCISAIVISFALGKSVGSFMYFFIEGFYSL